MDSKTIYGAGLTVLAAALASQVRAESPPATAPAQVIVTAVRPAQRVQLPVQTETVTSRTIAASINVVNTEDVVKYLPDILVRKRHIGDTQAPITTRTSGVGSSARSLIYADDVLVSALIGNNNSTASPRWGLIAPQEIDHIDVLYGPFAAAYPGNSIGEVVNIVTRMPTHLEAGVDILGAWQNFSEYATHEDLGSGQISAYVGDRAGPLAFWLSANHLTTTAQPLAFVTETAPSTTSAAGVPAAGAVAAVNRTGQPIQVIGAGSMEHQLQDNAKLKVSLDLSPSVTATYSVGVFSNQVNATARTYLANAAGDPVYAGTVNIAGQAISVPASAFDANVYHYDELHVGQSLKIASHTGGDFDWEVVGSLYDYVRDREEMPSGALPAANAGGPGTVTDMDGTGWGTLDLKGVWRPVAQEVSFGLHADQFDLISNKFNTPNWIAGPETSLATSSLGKTRTLAAWAQDAWAITPAVKLTLGARLETWNAFGGLNFSAVPALNQRQPALSATHISPKASLAWTPAAGWRLTASYGEAYRFPTVEELYQAVTTGVILSVPNPNLRPEDAHSGELSVERNWGKGSVRVSAFGEWVDNALISQTAPLLPGSTTLFSFVQNVGETRVLGVETVVEQDDVLVKGLSLTGSLVYADARTVADAALPSAVGKQLTGVPTWRATAVASYQATPRLTLTAAVRYSSRVFATINDIDPVTHTFQGFDPYLVADLRVAYQVTPHLTASLGVDNANDDNYFLFHPFPQRTVLAELKWAL